MSSILCIETSTEVCSVALSLDGCVEALREDKSGKNHAQLLTGFVEEVMHEKKMTFDTLNAIAISSGPGSYTGLRIGVSTAKGLCYAAGLPLIAISSLEAMTDHIVKNSKQYGLGDLQSYLFCPMIDARRMEVYAAIYNSELSMIRGIQADVVDHSTYSSHLVSHKLLFFGNGADKCQTTIQNPNAIFLEKITTSASHMAELAWKAFSSGKFEDVAYFEPFYLKDFVATIPTKNIYHTKKEINSPEE
jgi:tRNA threonylcarbamoyladenosine biosynthesis protein TsaB